MDTPNTVRPKQQVSIVSFYEMRRLTEPRTCREVGYRQHRRNDDLWWVCGKVGHWRSGHTAMRGDWWSNDAIATQSSQKSPNAYRARHSDAAATDARAKNSSATAQTFAVRSG